MPEFDNLLVQISGFKFKIATTTLNWLFICAISCIIFIYVGQKFKKADFKKAPTGILLVFEIYVTTLMSLMKANLGKHTNKYLPFFATIFMVMLPSNLVGLIGLTPPTSNVGLNLTIGITFFLLIQFTGIKNKGLLLRINDFFQPLWFLLPLNLIGEISLPFSMSLRLFGNILSGGIMLGLIYGLLKFLGIFGIFMYSFTPFLHVYFDIFSGVVQSYVFLMLGTFFLSQQLDMEEK